ncbi:MAG: hypothetical protein WCE93_04840 [Nitrososphaeraceae archaeon]
MKRKSPSLLLGILTFSLMLLLNPLSSVESGDPFQQQEESKSKPFKVIVNLEYTGKQHKEGVGKISVYYEDSDGFKKAKTYNFDEMMQRAYPDHVKVKAKFPRNSASHFEDYLICVKTLKDGHDNCINDSRSPNVDKERIHLKMP